MASNWIRLECESRDRGWTGELPASQYAAWAKFLLEVKANGKLGGCIAADHFRPRVLRNLRITRSTWDKMMTAANEHGAIDACGDEIIVVKWNQYQEDPTAAKRQDEWRKRQHGVTDITETPLRNGCNADGTGRDVTGRDGTGQEETPAPNRQKTPASGLAFDWQTGEITGITEAHRQRWRKAYAAVDIDAEILRAQEWQVANPEKRKKNYRRFLTNWFARTQEKGGSGGQADRRQTRPDSRKRGQAGLHQGTPERESGRSFTRGERITG